MNICLCNQRNQWYLSVYQYLTHFAANPKEMIAVQ
jgi:hypothetical protein